VASERALDFYRYIGKSEVEADRFGMGGHPERIPRLKGYDSAKQ